MNSSGSDPDLQVLAVLASTLRAEYIREGDADPWAGSPFAWIKTLPSRRVGKVGEQLITGWCAAKGISVLRSPDSQADRIIGGLRMEIKFSTLWANGTYTFQQIRDQDYDHVICLGLSPFSAHCWIVPKATVRANAVPQHAGREGSDTLWFTFAPSSPLPWLSGYGGTLDQAHQVLLSINRTF